MVDLSQQTEEKTKEITEVAKQLDAAIYEFNTMVSSIGNEQAKHGVDLLDHMPDDYYRLSGILFAMQRMRDFTKDKLISMSDLELSAAVRFVFEMSLWVSFLSGPDGSGKRYFASVVIENKKHVEKEIGQLTYEIANLRAAQNALDDRLKMLYETAKASGQQEPSESDVRKAIANCYEAYAKKFSIYKDWVKNGNFEEMAESLEKDHLSALQQDLASVDARIAALEAAGVTMKRMRTEDLAKSEDMVQEYSWLFSHTSRKIHGEPFSLSGEFYKLANHERFIYVDYLLFKVKEMLEISFKVFSGRKEFYDRLAESNS